MLFTQEHNELRRSVLAFVEAEMNPFIEQWEAEGIFPAHALFRKLGERGMLGITKPEAYGGMGLDYSFEVVFAEAIATAHCGGVPLAIGVQTNMATPALASFGSDTLREEFLAPAISGEMVASIAVSEPDAGSDVAAITTTARKDGDDYILNGSKMWITNATQADYFCVLANTGDGPKHANKSLIIVPANTPGVSVAGKLKKMGMRSSDTAPVFFDNVRVPQRYRIGEEGKGFIYQMQQFQEERLFGTAMALSQLETCVSSTITYTQERKAFGQPLIHNQSIYYALAEMQSECEALRSILYRATECHINGEDITKLASMAKLMAGRLSRSIPDKCLQFWGGMGYVEESIINRFYRDSRLVPIGGGVDEVMIGIIAKQLGIHPGKGG
ncbi:acyl-CoA dehydrogenase family protein [Spongiibacter sp. KMU-158]|uniref:Acyl-CoA dehydrogenase family protein n=1 Tax=Spongiibacter pelagi TaxID=2760804 RepID=A0A927GVV5_9GAMM|nr:acyl-CoA dehydrogenase family protein [Spongiibacter pelagi]MBD2858800.1 acyl-CoA dehydrogenase family protein [Spongiibacter pelagi]